jgi:hypothetical protein
MIILGLNAFRMRISSAALVRDGVLVGGCGGKSDSGNQALGGISVGSNRYCLKQARVEL